MLEQSCSAAVTQFLCDSPANRFGLSRRARIFFPQPLRPVRGKHSDIQQECSIVDAAPGANGHLAAASEAGERRSFGGHRAAAIRIFKPFKDAQSFSISRASLDPNRALSRGGQAHLVRQHFADVGAQAQAV